MGGFSRVGVPATFIPAPSEFGAGARSREGVVAAVTVSFARVGACSRVGVALGSRAVCVGTAVDLPVLAIGTAVTVVAVA